MTIELFKEFKDIAPHWSKILDNDQIIAQDGGWNIKHPESCFVGEMYLGKQYANECDECKKYSYLFMDLIVSIPLQFGISKWSAPRFEWRPELASATSSIDISKDRLKLIQERLLKMDSVIQEYRDLFNVIANDYMQHLSGCDHYNMQAGVLR